MTQSVKYKLEPHEVGALTLISHIKCVDLPTCYTCPLWIDDIKECTKQLVDRVLEEDAK